MKATTKSLIAFFSISAIVLGGSYNDLKFMDKGFMNDSEVKLSKRLDDVERSIASYEKNPAILWFPLNETNKSLINGAWNVYRFVDANDNIEELNAKIKFDLIGNGKVKLNDENDQIFNISYMTKSTIAIWKQVDGGFEIVEAKRVKVSAKKSNKRLTNEANQSESEVVEISNRRELELVGALNNKLFQGVLGAEKIYGSLIIDGDMVQDFRATIFPGTEKEKSVVFAIADVQSGVLTTASYGDEDVHGLIHHDADGSVKVTINSGELAGTIFNFSSEVKYNEISEDQRERDEEKNVDESTIANDTKEIQEAFTSEKIEEREISKEEMEEIANQNGFILTPVAMNE